MFKLLLFCSHWGKAFWKYGKHELNYNMDDINLFRSFPLGNMSRADSVLIVTILPQTFIKKVLSGRFYFNSSVLNSSAGRRRPSVCILKLKLSFLWPRAWEISDYAFWIFMTWIAVESNVSDSDMLFWTTGYSRFWMC